jgi:hypothetical protein
MTLLRVRDGVGIAGAVAARVMVPARVVPKHRENKKILARTAYRVRKCISIVLRVMKMIGSRRDDRVEV